MFEGAGHVPWEYGGATQDDMIDFVSDNLYPALDFMTIGIQELAVNNIGVFPNPTKEIFTIKTQNIFTQIIVYTLIGSKVVTLGNVKTVNI